MSVRGNDRNPERFGWVRNMTAGDSICWSRTPRSLVPGDGLRGWTDGTSQHGLLGTVLKRSRSEGLGGG